MPYRDKRCPCCDALIPESRPRCECGQRFYLPLEVPNGWMARIDLLVHRTVMRLNKVFFSGALCCWLLSHLT